MDGAPLRLVSEALVRAPHAAVRDAIVGDPNWSWFPGFKDGGLEGDHRWVHIGRFRYDETILARDGNGFTFRVNETNSPYAKAIVEDWRAEPHPDGALARWTFAADPRWMLRMPGAQSVMRNAFRRGMRNLGARLL